MNRSVAQTVAALCASVLLLTACGGGGGGSSIPTTVGAALPNPAAGQPPSTGQLVWGQSVIASLPYHGPAQVGALSIHVSVKMQNAAGLLQYAAAANNPASPLYRHWLTPQQIADRFGASQADYQAAASYLAKDGLKVGMWPQRESLAVSGTVGQFAKAFGTAFGTYTFNGKTVIAPIGAPKVAANVPIAGVSPMMSAPIHRSFFMRGINNAGFYGYSPQQVATGFDFSGGYSAGYKGAGINVGIIGTGPILNASGGDDDLAAYKSFWNAPMATLTQVAASPQPATQANGGTGTSVFDSNPTGLSTPPPVTQPCALQFEGVLQSWNTCNPEDGEAQLDTQMVASLAPASNVLFYLAFNPGYCIDNTTGAGSNDTGTCPAGTTQTAFEGISLTDDELQQAIADNKADAISMSFGLPENLALAFGDITSNPNSPGAEQVEMASLESEGVALFVSSGDNGAWECVDPSTGAPLGTACVSYPASDPNVTAVGGVNIPLDGGGNLMGAMSAWADNTTLGGDGSFRNNVGSGGGVSTAFTAPAWQSATVANTIMRKVPDMSLDADPASGQSIIVNHAYSGTPSASGGTSMSAPQAAAQWALVLQACKATATCLGPGGTYRLGNPAPILYAIYGTSSNAKGPYTVTNFTPALNYEHVFYDVLYGGNQAVPSGTTPQPASTPNGYQSGTGYDMVTGLGAPYTGHLIQAITGQVVP